LIEPCVCPSLNARTRSRLAVDFSPSSAIGRRPYAEFGSQKLWCTHAEHVRLRPAGRSIAVESVSGLGLLMQFSSPNNIAASSKGVATPSPPMFDEAYASFGIPDARSPPPKLGRKCLSAFDSSDAAPRGSSILLVWRSR
jgi:hypothetical protein